MLRWSQVGGIALVVIGLLVLLRIILPFPIGGIILALVLIALGVLVIRSATRGSPSSLPREDASIPLEGATEASVTLRHGAGRLRIGSGAPSGSLVSGSFGGGLDAHTSRDGGRLRVEMRVKQRPWGDFIFPWLHGRFETLDWDLAFLKDTPLVLELDTGAGEGRIDLTELQVRELRLKTGASSTTLDLPAHAGRTVCRIESGVASVKVHVPEGVAADIRVRAAIAGARVDRARFPVAEGTNHYRSPDYDTADNRVQIDVDTGVGSITVG